MLFRSIMVWSTGVQCPYKHQYELAAWAQKRWPNDPPSKYAKMTYKRLYAIWCAAHAETGIWQLAKKGETL